MGEGLIEVPGKEGGLNFGKDTLQALRSHTMLLKLNYQVLACHCECLGMNGENMFSAIAGEAPMFAKKDYDEAMQKWGLLNKEGKPNL